MDTREIFSRIFAVDWAKYDTAFGNAADTARRRTLFGEKMHPPVGRTLCDIFSQDGRVVRRASNELWECLCGEHEHAYSAALPAYDFMAEAIRSGNDRTQELLTYIITDIALYVKDAPTDGEAWESELRRKISGDIPLYRKLSDSPNEDLACFAGVIAEEYDKA